MTIIIKNKTSKIELEKLLLKFAKSKSKKSLRNVFGKNTIKGDGFAVKNFSDTSQTDNKNNLLLDVSLEENQENLNKPIVSNANEAINLENNVFVESDKEESIQNQLILLLLIY